MSICFSENGIFLNDGSFKNKRVNKGKSILEFPSDFTVIDLETSGLEPRYDKIIEVAALRIRSNCIVDTFNSLINPECEICEYITYLTGITNEMLENAPTIDRVLPDFLNFLSDDIIIGHNVNFDINFIYDNCENVLNKSFKNDFVDTMRLSRKLLPGLEHHRLSDVAENFNLSLENAHRALDDCMTTFQCFLNLRSLAIEQYTDLEQFSAYCKKNKLDLKSITTKKTTFDETNLFYGKHCVFTGTLEKMPRAQAAQMVVDLGGICDNSVTKKTNYLILGNNYYCTTIKDGKSSKQKKAEAYILQGLDLQILSENVFYEMIEAE